MFWKKRIKNNNTYFSDKKTWKIYKTSWFLNDIKPVKIKKKKFKFFNF